jgi:tryptophan halogenase
MKKNKIVIVGGGSAGWITLSYLSATTDAELVLIHSNEIDSIGVGESTTPTIKHIAETVGVPEYEWMKQSKATFKYGVDFHDFNSLGSRWVHTFDDMIPHQAFTRPLCDNGKEEFKRDLTSVDYFLHHYGKDVSLFNETHGPQEYLIKNKLSPFNKNGINNINKFPGYGYHVNAFEFGKCLKNHVPETRYEEINATIIEVVENNDGIEYVVLDTGEKIYGDIFFDCSGFTRVLMKNLSTWDSYTELVNDRAIWGEIHNVTSDEPVTGVYAQESGWIWTIPTWNQIGSGYVYSNKFSSDERAEEVITDFWRERGYKFVKRKQVAFDAGRLNNVTFKNVISNGLAQSFIEPLEATSLMITCVTVRSFSDLYNKHKIWSAKTSSIHDRIMKRFIDHTKKFVLYHYRLSERIDTPYWRSVGNDPTAVQEVSDYIDILASSKWVGKGDTLLNQWNWVSMLLGFNKKYTNKLKSDVDIDDYLLYNKTLIYHYQSLVGQNIPILDLLNKINNT